MASYPDQNHFPAIAIFTLTLSSASLNIYHLRQSLMLFLRQKTTKSAKQQQQLHPPNFPHTPLSHRERHITRAYGPNELINLLLLHVVQVILAVLVAFSGSSSLKLLLSTDFYQLVLQLLHCTLHLSLFAVELRRYFSVFGGASSAQRATFLLSYLSLFGGLLYMLALLYTFYLEHPTLLYRLMVVEVVADAGSSSSASPSPSADYSGTLCNRSYENRSANGDESTLFTTCYSPLLKPI
ncbi:hypothetical protein TYRP_012019 [Tyrophagus putrescentiae]|nr:hypothetical protein TYRP_012019 [Tyrophagus putrescentiae]